MQDVEPSTSSPFAEHSPQGAAQPRSGIVHLMIWMAGSAAILAEQRAVGLWEEGQPEPFRTLQLVMAFPESAIEGAVVGGFVVAMVRLARRQVFPVHPGQWLVVLLGAMTMGAWAAWTAARWQF